MEILEISITETEISLSTSPEVDELILSYGDHLATKYTLSGVGSTTVTITNTDLGLDTLNNIYFKLEVIDTIDRLDSAGLYTIEIINNLESKLYQANNLKHELDNMNYYDGIVQDLTNKRDYLTANDMFNNYINFLETQLYGNNFIHSIGRQNSARSHN